MSDTVLVNPTIQPFPVSRRVVRAPVVEVPPEAERDRYRIFARDEARAAWDTIADEFRLDDGRITRNGLDATNVYSGTSRVVFSFAGSWCQLSAGQVAWRLAFGHWPKGRVRLRDPRLGYVADNMRQTETSRRPRSRRAFQSDQRRAAKPDKP